MNHILEKSALNGLTRLLQSLANQRRDFVENFRTVNRHFTQNLPVQLDISERQSINKSRIRQTSHLCGSFDSDDPQGAEFTFAVSAITIRENPVPDDRLFDESQQILSAAITPFDLAKQSLVGSTTGNAKTNSHDGIQ
jgi:hypothetical protein